MAENEIVWTIVVAAGSGLRFGAAKQFETIGGKRIVDWAVDEAIQHSVGVIVVLPKGQANGPGQVEGGATRSESVRRGLAAVPADATIVCVHDAARPFASPAVFQRVISAVVDGADASVPGIAVVDTIKQVNESEVVVSTPRRETLRAVQTPQAFRASSLRRAHEQGGEGTDDAALIERIGGEVVVVEGEVVNRKITSPEDLEWAVAHAIRLLAGEI
ncbi:MAG: 2-C-methyl-D-erythritol 4-phosphate cytidylyltransferase [Actinobacteria bacterium]|jgi:2-C-methyl-D-erythritol 4-phosphate cytidylyltransferase|uniref:2-C-methyl-D-erythritol 4-phosphate cytidylyltransferase n=1 Tax=freshwater metagenome TaxID=449393 RepID=A0A6J7T3X5_9ZZZZ|nr:2-C-methyl-D-erythritol 4-phosphate cytidylyltransferase [Actinomycetota bacterium]MSZ60567.1 2-C-methyl-D-erythritol 4-phosphate cytidylyltransferase [Actinomycetota bacterium]MSZ80855.1 2-C-methyl-D-erythritol 4-phosphate cytidylyltransferase [Actinomycetota bacterium]MTB12352.1 2-C-methyl-D-erythritol 4-phosphate cytidylyltransferase [Actinomycetota bacterium]